ncbi:GH25 family lysozyme [Companilactobacillus farciminis]|uniref:GH25 family lysozyme n=1 Tax=Companilactobacillus farciminis TaxID=1612 RepID=UPI00232C95AB|nr:GH25 family lysozyme [Companilactobacillus farciminis]WCG36629.1 GH25 family lysozyme [Companilactobacillus farciminis]
MVLKRKRTILLAVFFSLIVVLLGATKVSAARADMVDVSNNNGAMTVTNFQDMHDNYGVKAVVTKISEDTSFKDSTAANNIATAQQAGMYINGYHFARYNSVASAIAEADYAGKLAQADGLPAGAVLATDVESSEQSSVSEAQNDADNQAFMTEVAKYGYRSTIYTMGSWVGSVMSVDSGWIASYPYDPTGQEWYTSNHGWQWSSSYTFNGSYGNFDVSELYDNFFTTYQAPTGTSTTTTSDDNSATTNSSSSNVGVIEVNNSSSSYVPLMALQADGSMKTITNRALSNNTSWQTDQIKVVNGTTYYRVATNEWVAEQYLANNSSTTNAASDANVIKVNNANSSYVQLVALQADGSMKTITNRALANNTSWQTDQTKVVDGTTYYRVATNEWINAEYII